MGENTDDKKQMSLGTWSKVCESSKYEKKPQVKFTINVKTKVKFLENDPKELEGDTGAYYIFDVEHDGENKIIMTSAWTLLRELSKFVPLKNKTLTIVKELVKGKQTFKVNE
jgi:hypothetical protein